MGPGGHVLTFPIDHGQTMNVVAFHTTEEEWADSNKLTAPATREDALRDFEGFGDNVRNVLKLAEPELDVVSIFRLACCAFMLIHSFSGPSLTPAPIQFHRLIRVESAWSEMQLTPVHLTMVQEQEWVSKTALCCQNSWQTGSLQTLATLKMLWESSTA